MLNLKEHKLLKRNTTGHDFERRVDSEGFDISDCCEEVLLNVGTSHQIRMEVSRRIHPGIPTNLRAKTCK